MMRQAGRYLPEYRATRAQAGDFLSLCYTPELAAEVTLQPIRRYGFDAAIVFADILLLAQALGSDLWFVEGEGPRLSPIRSRADIEALAPLAAIHERLAPIAQTLRLVRQELPPQTTLIGFAGAPWTVATYMIAGRGTPDQAPAHALKHKAPEAFARLIERLTEATIAYLSMQIEAGAEVVKLFDSWAGSLRGADFATYAIAPTRTIVANLRHRYPQVPIIVFPRGAGGHYAGFAKATGAQCVALDDSIAPQWAARHVQPDGCVQGNLAAAHMVSGGPALVRQTQHIVESFRHGPHIFNLGHGITPKADPHHVQHMIETIRSGAKRHP